MLNEFTEPAGQSSEVVDGTLVAQEGGTVLPRVLIFFSRRWQKETNLTENL